MSSESLAIRSTSYFLTISLPATDLSAIFVSLFLFLCCCKYPKLYWCCSFSTWQLDSLSDQLFHYQSQIVFDFSCAWRCIFWLQPLIYWWVGPEFSLLVFFQYFWNVYKNAYELSCIFLSWPLIKEFNYVDAFSTLWDGISSSPNVTVGGGPSIVGGFLKQASSIWFHWY